MVNKQFFLIAELSFLAGHGLYNSTVEDRLTAAEEKFQSASSPQFVLAALPQRHLGLSSILD